MKIKALEVYNHEYYSDDYSGQLYTLGNTTDWDDVSQEEFELLKRWVARKNSEQHGMKYVIVKESNISIPKVIKEFVERAKTEEAQAAEHARKMQEAAAKREAAVKQKKEDKKRKLYEELKGEFEQ